MKICLAYFRSSGIDYPGPKYRHQVGDGAGNGEGYSENCLLMLEVSYQLAMHQLLHVLGLPRQDWIGGDFSVDLREEGVIEEPSICILSGDNPPWQLQMTLLQMTTSDSTGFLPLGVRLEGEGISFKIFAILASPCQVSSGGSRRDVGGCTGREWSHVFTGCHIHLQSLHTTPLQILVQIF